MMMADDDDDIEDDDLEDEAEVKLLKFLFIFDRKLISGLYNRLFFFFFKILASRRNFNFPVFSGSPFSSLNFFFVAISFFHFFLEVQF